MAAAAAFQAFRLRLAAKCSDASFVDAIICFSEGWAGGEIYRSKKGRCRFILLKIMERNYSKKGLNRKE
ncbi:MAG: hypothetical protein IJI24_04430, partial [Lachnospiraceae bacterium]|nr:hypothetical protein [Lachnospiraceae bacterium]